MEPVQAALWVVILLVALALLFDFMNGFHDAANSIATVVSTGVLKPAHAVMFAAFFNVVAIFVFHLSVAATVGKGIVQPGIVDTHVVFGALVGAISWNVITWIYGIPSSSSHALIGGIVGAVMAKAGAGALIASGIWKTVAFIFVSPVLGFLLGSLMMVLVAWIFRRASPNRVDKWFRRLQLASAAAYSLWQGNLDAAWELDLWGRVRREVEAADARVDVALETQRGVLLAVLAETARDYIELRGAQQTLAITQQVLDIARHTLSLTRIRLQEGATTQLDVAEAAAHVATIEARLPPLQQRVARLGNALALLLALPPQALQAELAAGKDIPAVAMQVQLGVPSGLAERRPDIRRAEALLHAATADVGVAHGDFYPRITLSGSIGLQAMRLSDIGWDAKRFAFGPGFSVPLFDGGRLRGNLHLREAQQQEAAIAYRHTVLAAWHEVEDALSGYQANQRRQASLDEAVRQGRRALGSAELQYRQGGADLINVLHVQNTLLNNEAALVDSRATASLSLVQVYKALGGGWQSLSSTTEGNTP